MEEGGRSTANSSKQMRLKARRRSESKNRGDFCTNSKRQKRFIRLSVDCSRTAMSSNNDSQVERDREEVESLNRRLLERDMKATRNTSSLNPIAVDSEINKMSEEQKRSLVPQLRELSRQEYLQKREKMKLELLQKEVEEEEMVYSDSELTGREKRSREEKKVGGKR